MTDSATLYRVAPILIRSLGANAALVQRFGREELHVLPTRLIDLVSKCNSLKPLATHAKEVWRELSLRERVAHLYSVLKTYQDQEGSIVLGMGAFSEMLHTVFVNLEKQGIFLSRNALMQSTAPSTGVPISQIAIPTRNRTLSLKACVTSYLQNAQSFGHDASICIYDNSPERLQRNENISALAAVKKELGGQICYIGTEERASFKNALIASGISASLLDFALEDHSLLGMAYGANRNAVLLNTVGETVLSVDDDTICRPVRSTQCASGLTLTAKESAQKVVHLFTQEDRGAHYEELSEDVLDMHERYLGRQLGEVLSGLGHDEPLNMEATAGWLLRELEDGRARILATYNGLYGDSGSNAPDGFLFLGEEGRRAVLKDRESFERAAVNRQVLKYSTSPVIERVSGCMTTFFGLDHRDIVPPFFPNYRNEDALFGEMLGLCYRGGLACYLPSALAHFPSEQRAKTNGSRDDLAPFWPAEFIRIFLSSITIPITRADGAARVKSLGDCVIELASLSSKEYCAVACELFSAERSRHVDRLESLLSKYPRSPKFWKERVRSLIEEGRALARKPMALAPAPIIKTLGEAEAERVAKEQVLNFGMLLKEWPTICEAAKRLKEEGQGMGREIE